MEAFPNCLKGLNRSTHCRQRWGNRIRRVLLRLYYAGRRLYRYCSTCHHFGLKYQQFQIVVVGLPNSGKTSFCLRLGQIVSTTEPLNTWALTHGNSVNSVVTFTYSHTLAFFSRSVAVKYFEIGGTSRTWEWIQPKEHIYATSHAVIVVINLENEITKSRLRKYIQSILRNEYLTHKPIFVVGAKSDMATVQWTSAKFSEQMGLIDLATELKCPILGFVIGKSTSTRKIQIQINRFIQNLVNIGDELHQRVMTDLTNMISKKEEAKETHQIGDFCESEISSRTYSSYTSPSDIFQDLNDFVHSHNHPNEYDQVFFESNLEFAADLFSNKITEKQPKILKTSQNIEVIFIPPPLDICGEVDLDPDTPSWIEDLGVGDTLFTVDDKSRTKSAMSARKSAEHEKFNILFETTRCKDEAEEMGDPVICLGKFIMGIQDMNADGPDLVSSIEK